MNDTTLEPRRAQEASPNAIENMQEARLDILNGLHAIKMITDQQNLPAWQNQPDHARSAVNWIVSQLGQHARKLGEALDGFIETTEAG